MNEHLMLNPASLPAPRGFSHAVVAAAGRTIFLAGQVGHDAEGRIVGPEMADQFDRAAQNILQVLSSAGARPEHLVSMQVFVTDASAYRASLARLGEIWRTRFGRHYPALALFEVSGLFDPDAKVELMAIAVVPER